MKFLVRDRGFDWLRVEIEKEFAKILAEGGIAWPETVPEGFGGHQSRPQPLGNGALLPVVSGPQNGAGWRRSNVRLQKQAGYAAVTIKVDQGNLTGDQLRVVARMAADAGDGLVRVMIDQNLLLGFIPLARAGWRSCGTRRRWIGRIGRAKEIEDVTLVPGPIRATWGSRSR